MPVSHARGAIVPAVAIVLAALLRLYGLADAQYRNDDETMVYLAERTLAGGFLPIRGMQSSMGVDNGPTALILLLVPAALRASEQAFTTFMAGVDVTAIGLYWFFTRRFFGARIASVATLLMALNPWAVIYARRAWLNAAIPLFTVLFLWALFALIDAFERNGAAMNATAEQARLLRRRAIVCGLALAGLVQVHLSGIAALYVVLLAFVVAPLWQRRATFKTAALIFVAIMAPYALWVATPGIARVAGRFVLGRSAVPGGMPIVIADWPRIRVALELLTAHGYQVYATQAARLIDTRVGVFLAADAAIVTLFLVGLVMVARRAHRGATRSAAVDWLLLGSVLLPILAPAPAPSLRGFAHIYPVYLVIALPGMLILAAEGFAAVWRAAAAISPVMIVVPAMCLAGILASYAAAAAAFFPVRHEFWPDGADYGAPLRQTVAVADLATRRAGPSPILVGGHEQFADVWHRAILRRGAMATYFDDHRLLPILRGGTSIYVTSDDRTWATGHLRRHFAPQQIDEVVIPGAHRKARVFRIDGDMLASTISPMETVGMPIGALVFIDAAAVPARAQAGTPCSVQVRWRFLQTPTVPHVIRLLIETQPTRFVTVDETLFYPTMAWRPGDGDALSKLEFVQRLEGRLPADTAPGPHDVAVTFRELWGGALVGDPVRIGAVEVERP